MKEVSKGDDCRWLAQQLKNKLGNYVSFNEFGPDNDILTGVYDKDGGLPGPLYSEKSVMFYIKFCKENFLRIQIEIGSSSNGNIANAMTGLIDALARIKKYDNPMMAYINNDDNNPIIGFPLAIYKVDNCLISEYAFKNQEEVIEALKNNTWFVGSDIEDLHFLRSCRTCHYRHLSNEALYCCLNSFKGMETQENNTCIDHVYIKGTEPDIKRLCNIICSNERYYL